MLAFWVVLIALAVLVGACSSATVPAPVPTPELVQEQTHTLFFYWEPSCQFCLMMLEDINLAIDAGYLENLGVRVVGLQVADELVDGMKFQNLPGTLPKGILGTPYTVLWDFTTVPPTSPLTIYGYAPLEVWMNLLLASL